MQHELVRELRTQSQNLKCLHLLFVHGPFQAIIQFLDLQSSATQHKLAVVGCVKTIHPFCYFGPNQRFSVSTYRIPYLDLDHPMLSEAKIDMAFNSRMSSKRNRHLKVNDLRTRPFKGNDLSLGVVIRISYHANHNQSTLDTRKRIRFYKVGIKLSLIRSKFRQ